LMLEHSPRSVQIFIFISLIKTNEASSLRVVIEQ
jgi:hypothetical protein